MIPINLELLGFPISQSELAICAAESRTLFPHGFLAKPNMGRIYETKLRVLRIYINDSFNRRLFDERYSSPVYTLFKKPNICRNIHVRYEIIRIIRKLNTSYNFALKIVCFKFLMNNIIIYWSISGYIEINIKIYLPM